MAPGSCVWGAVQRHVPGAYKTVGTCLSQHSETQRCRWAGHCCVQSRDNAAARSKPLPCNGHRTCLSINHRVHIRGNSRTPPPPDQSDHRGKQQNSQKGKSCRAIFGTQTFGSQTPHPSSLQMTSLRKCRAFCARGKALLSPGLERS